MVKISEVSDGLSEGIKKLKGKTVSQQQLKEMVKGVPGAIVKKGKEGVEIHETLMEE
jgi:hypothetical protein